MDGNTVTMRRVILMISISLDGFIEGPNRELDWQLVDDAAPALHDEPCGMGAFLGGRGTHELMAGFCSAD